MAPWKPAPRPASYDKRVALVLQGGGALGSYQAGVYEALAESAYLPDWVAGISIGAINAAIIAGNAPAERVARLKSFWDEITEPTAGWPANPGGHLSDAYQRASALSSLLLGQPGFFTPQKPWAWFRSQGPISYYDTAPLKATLERLVDFDRINRKETRFSVGAVNVETGNFAYFDNAEISIRPEHVMASGALPPGFPPIEIDGQHYWDGGLVSNTPLHHILSYYPRRSMLAFQVDVFSARGALPTELDAASERAKDIQYSSRTRMGTERFREMHDIRHNLEILLEQLPENLKQQPAARFLSAIACVTTMDIAQLIYRTSEPQGACKDYEFSRSTMLARWAEGRADAETTLSAAPWLQPAPPEMGARTFDVLRGPRAAAPALAAAEPGAERPERSAKTAS